MRVRIDGAGRLVVPKSFRRLIGMEHGGEVDVTVDGAALRLEPIVARQREIELVDGWPVLTADGDRSISDADVQQLRDDQQ